MPSTTAVSIMFVGCPLSLRPLTRRSHCTRWSTYFNEHCEWTLLKGFQGHRGVKVKVAETFVSGCIDDGRFVVVQHVVYFDELL